MKQKIKMISDILSIVFPALIAVFGILGASGAIDIVNKTWEIAGIILGSIGAIASVTYNVVTGQIKAEEGG